MLQESLSSSFHSVADEVAARLTDPRRSQVWLVLGEVPHRLNRTRPALMELRDHSSLQISVLNILWVLFYIAFTIDILLYRVVCGNFRFL